MEFKCNFIATYLNKSINYKRELEARSINVLYVIDTEDCIRWGQTTRTSEFETQVKSSNCYVRESEYGLFKSWQSQLTLNLDTTRLHPSLYNDEGEVVYAVIEGLVLWRLCH